MKAYIYILFSENMNRFYVGVTQKSVEQRLDKHNTHAYGRHRYTASDTDWCVFFVIEVNNYSHAVRIERKIKSMKSRTYIYNLKKYPELQQKLIDQTST
ncbi:MAG: GIY-YIG nuclease family protein [Prolixibacteraceae bacterium]